MGERLIPLNFQSNHAFIHYHRFRDYTALRSGGVVPGGVFWESGLVVVGDHGVEVQFWSYYYASYGVGTVVYSGIMYLEELPDPDELGELHFRLLFGGEGKKETRRIGCKRSLAVELVLILEKFEILEARI